MDVSKRFLTTVTLAILVVLPPALATGQEQAKPDESITYRGLTGLFNVLSPDTLMRGETSFGVTHRNYDREVSDLDVNDAAASIAYGVHDRLELALTYVGNRQMDFDEPSSGIYNNYPKSISTIENNGGDLSVGAKFAIAQMEQSGAGLALLGIVKIPTGNDEEGASTGGADFTVGAAAGVDNGTIGLYGNAAYTLVGDTSDDLGGVDLADVFSWGAGLELGSDGWLRGIAELTGETFTSLPTNFPAQEDALDLTLGFKLGGAGWGSGIAFGGAWVRNLAMDAGDNPTGWIGELSFTTAPAPPPEPMDKMMEPTNHPPTATATARPDEIYPSYSAKVNRSTVTAAASDPDGDPLTYHWTASGGQLNGSGPSVTWSPPADVDDGTYTVTVRVSDGRGGEATASDTIRVIPDPEWFAGRVLFGFDRYDLDSEDLAVVQQAASHLQRFPELKLMLEGHTCFIATEEYNLALGQQRADAIRAALAGAGVDSARIRTISYGEARPWQDNSREITRRLNRRGEFRFRFSR